MALVELQAAEMQFVFAPVHRSCLKYFCSEGGAGLRNTCVQSKGAMADQSWSLCVCGDVKNVFAVLVKVVNYQSRCQLLYYFMS